MVKLDVSLLRFLDDEDFRVMTALEMSMRNHDVAPTALIERIAQLQHGGARKRLNNLLKHKLIHHENTAYDGYAMKYGAYDFLALRTLSKRGTVTGVGSRIGCGKESDIICVQDESGNDCVLKLQRLGRCSFRTVARNRDYKNGKGRHGESWFYMSRLASQKEYAFMKMLYDEGVPVPKPIDQNRHGLVMEYVKGTLLNHIQEMDQAQKVYERCLALMVKLAEHGLIHGDFNEFNLFVTEEYRVVMIDFPQMISTDHHNAAELFDRDVQNLANFFHRRFRVEQLLYPQLETDVVRVAELDRQAFASGFFSKKQQVELEKLMDDDAEQDKGDDDDEGEEEEEEEDGDQEGDEEEVEEGGAVEPSGTEVNEKAAPKVAESSPTAVEKREQQADDKGDDEEDEEGEEDRSCSSSNSADDTIARTRKLRTRRAIQDNPNLNPDGTVNQAFIRDQVRRNLRRHDNHEFNKSLHRNSQKGRDKRRVRRVLKTDSDLHAGGGW